METVEDRLNAITYSPAEIAKAWSGWCGETAWTKEMLKLEGTGCKVIWYCGYPQSVSAIPLCFVIVLPNGKDIGRGHSRLKYIRLANKILNNKGGVKTV